MDATEFRSRKTLRLIDFDYGAYGMYFVTFCTAEHMTLLGDIRHDGDEIALTEYGEITKRHIEKIDARYKNIHIDKYCIMPNHVHMIIEITEIKKVANTSVNTSANASVNASANTSANTSVNASVNASANASANMSANTSADIPTVIRTLKTMITRECGGSIWQRSYYDHIIRNESEYEKIWEYIDTNPIKWANDELYKVITI